MKHILSVILVAALVFNANAVSAQTLEDTSAFVEGFTKQLNMADPAFGSCKSALLNVSTAFNIAVNKSQSFFEDESVEQAIGNLGYQFAHSIRVCAKVVKTTSNMFATLGSDVMNMNTSTLDDRLMMNMFMLSLKYQAGVTAYNRSDFKTLGQLIADTFAVIVFENSMSRTPRQLSLASVKNSSSNFNATFLAFYGFLESANTTIVVKDYESLFNNVFDMVDLASGLPAAVQKMDFITILGTMQKLQVAFQNASSAFKTLDQEIDQTIERDLPLFDTNEEIQKIGYYLMLNMPTTMTIVTKINNSYKSGDFELFGKGIGELYNLAKKGSMSSF